MLLVRFEFHRGTLWATPGGGQEPGEDDAATVRRELDEEVGLRDPDVGAHLWTRTVIVPFLDGSWDGQCERVYLVRSASFVPRPTMSWEQLMAEHVHELRWWSVEELLEAGQQGVRFAPPRAPGPGGGHRHRWPAGEPASDRTVTAVGRRRPPG